MIMNPRVERLIERFAIHFGSHGNSLPNSICTDKNNKGTAKKVVTPGIYGIGTDTGRAKIISNMPNPLSCRDIRNSSIEILLERFALITLCKKSDVDNLLLSILFLVRSVNIIKVI